MKRLKEHLKNKYLFLILVLLISCKKERINFEYKKINKFSPYFHTNIPINEIDSVWLIKYKKVPVLNNTVDSSKICIKYISKDVGYSTKWKFKLCDSLNVDYDYKIKLTFKRKSYTYLLTEIIYDTLKVYEGYIYKTKKYKLNDTIYSGDKCNYVLK